MRRNEIVYEFRRLGPEDKESIKEVFAGVFTKEPWNDDWSDKEQLDLYITDLIGQGYSLTYGLYDSDELIGISLGHIKHWYSGTEYYIEELCIRTDRQGAGAGTFFLAEIEKAIQKLGLKQIFLLTDSNVPAYEFYKKNGFFEVETNAGMAKALDR
ncbi:MAG: GNAT family N-acetyltransferase [Lachnospiraceae bacterium]|nr:GNAT family N-acetyltransferase [Lachnospiraceae bacterium]